MFKNYIKTALRGFWRNKFFTLVNVLGLTIGISSALVIFVIIHSELTFNQFALENKNLYRVVSSSNFSGEVFFSGGVPAPLGDAMKTNFEGLEKSAPFFTLSNLDVYVSKSNKRLGSFKNQDNIVLADSRYFNLFKYKWLAGYQKTALIKPNEVVLTSEQSIKYFPGKSYANIIGNVIYYDSIPATVKGIVESLDQNTDFTFHDFLSYRTAYTNKTLLDQLQINEWGHTTLDCQLFVKLKSNKPKVDFEKQLKALLAKTNPPKAKINDKQALYLQSIDDLHFNDKFGAFTTSETINKSTLQGLTFIAAFLLLIGCINFINLTTAQSSTRAKETGVRKTLGSMRSQLIFQSFTETFLISLFGVILSFLFAPVLFIVFKDFIPTGVITNFFEEPVIYVFLLLLTILISVLSGLYPALKLSGLNPVYVLKNQIDPTTNKSRASFLRRLLTIVQFGIAIFSLIATSVVTKQIYYALNKDLGFRKEAVLILTTPWKTSTLSKSQVLFNKLNSISGIELVSKANETPLSSNSNTNQMHYRKGKKEIAINIQTKYADENYINVYQIPLLAGRNLKSTDTSNSLLINKSMAAALGFTSPQDAVDHFIDTGGGNIATIIGVVADFSQKSVHTHISPLAIEKRDYVFANATMHIALKPNTERHTWTNTIKEIQKSFGQVYPSEDFEYHFFDEQIAKIYETEQRTATLLSWATALTIFISCLGLLGLAIYTSNRRKKEIGVRKVLGASVTQLVAMLSTELVQLVIISFILVSPLSFWTMNKWMENFAYKTSLNWWVFGGRGLIMLLISLFALSFQTIRAATANPVDSLRTE